MWQQVVVATGSKYSLLALNRTSSWAIWVHNMLSICEVPKIDAYDIQGQKDSVAWLVLHEKPCQSA